MGNFRLTSWIIVATTFLGAGASPANAQVEIDQLISALKSESIVEELPRADINIDLPPTSDTPIKVDSYQGTLAIELPLDESVPSNQISEGLTTYSESYGTSFAVVSKTDGAQIVSQIMSEADPEKYKFKLNGDFTTGAVQSNGAVFLFKSDGTILGGFFPAWARDARGVSVPTNYEFEGRELVQTVAHKSMADVKYPITFDPSYASGVLSRSDDHRYLGAGGGYQISAWLSAWGRLVYTVDSRFLTAEVWTLFRKYHWQTTGTTWVTSLQQQWECHILGGWLEWDSWDLETKRPANPNWASRISNNLLSPASVCNW